MKDISTKGEIEKEELKKDGKEKEKLREDENDASLEKFTIALLKFSGCSEVLMKMLQCGLREISRIPGFMYQITMNLFKS